jgi:hypothetical protein
VEWVEGFLGEGGDLADIVMIGDDLSGQNGPFFPLRYYREIIRPRQLAAYVFNRVHNIRPEVPPENVVALYEAAYEFGFYD